MVSSALLVLSFLVCQVLGSFNESLHLKPLPRNKLMASWDFDIKSESNQLEFYNTSSSSDLASGLLEDHFSDFPRALGPIIQTTNTRELHLRFTQGWYDLESWGKLPKDGLRSGGTGVELWAIIEAEDVHGARESWKRLTNSLSGFFCASLNFIDDSITTFPKNLAQQQENLHLPLIVGTNKLYLLRASLPSEPVCTENLTPFLKLIPSRGKAGVSSLLEGHKVFDSLWQGMSIDITTESNDDGDHYLSMHQSVNSIIDIIRSIRKRKEGGIPKPTPGDDLRCDPKKVSNIWQCFPLNDPTEISWGLESILGRKIKGPALLEKSSKVIIDVDPSWNVTVSKAKALDTVGAFSLHEEKLATESGASIVYSLDELVEYDFIFETSDSTITSPIEEPPIKASRSLSGYSQGQGGFRVSLTNPSSEKIEFVYYEVLPWYMRLYLNTLTMEISKTANGKDDQDIELIGGEDQFIKSRYYKPAIDRKRPSHLEFTIELPAHTTMTLNYQFDKSLLLYSEYPPDANHGFTVEPAVITVLDPQTKQTLYELRTTSSLVTLPTPDFSMPYNVIILTSTIMALVFGSVFNLLVRRVITEAEADQFVQKNSKLKVIIEKLKSKIQILTKRKVTKVD